MTKASGLQFLAEHLGFSPEQGGRIRGRRERHRAPRMGRIRGRGRERARARDRGRRLRLPAGDRGGSRPGDRSRPRIARMIDVRAARADPDSWRAALARKGAAEVFDGFLAADEAWRAATHARRRAPRGKPAEGQAISGGDRAPQPRSRTSCKEAEAALEEAAARRDELLTQIPNPPRPHRSRRRHRRGRGGGPPLGRAAAARLRAARPPRARGDRHGARRRRSPARASPTGSATPRCRARALPLRPRPR